MLEHLARTTSLVSSAAVLHRCSIILVDGENIDASIGSLLRRRPRSSERPRWERLPDFFARMHDVKALMYLVDRETPPFRSFVNVLPDLGFKPIVLSAKLGVPVVDRAIQATLACIPSHTDVVLVSNDGGFMEHLEPLVAPDRRVVIIGFEEYISHKFREHRENGDIEFYDLERDIGAFDEPLPRETMPAVDLDDFDPRKLI